MMTNKEKLRLSLKAEVFKAMGQPTRLAIIELLQQGELTVGQIAGHLASDTPNISKHLSLLRKANWVGDRKQGTNTFYRLLVPQAAQYLQCVDRKTRRQLEQNTRVEADAETGESAQENPADRSDDCTHPDRKMLGNSPKSSS